MALLKWILNLNKPEVDRPKPAGKIGINKGYDLEIWSKNKFREPKN